MKEIVAEAELTPDQLAILELAAERIASVFGITTTQTHAPSAVFEETVYGAFVTLKRNGQLRACYGNCGEMRSLRDAVTSAAHAVATSDHRFAAFSHRELQFLRIDVSLLHNLRTLDVAPESRAESVVIGQHGVTLRGRQTGALLLPQVAPEWGWDAPQLLAQLCRKAGLDAQAWKHRDITLSTFEARILEANFDRFIRAESASEQPGPAAMLPIEAIRNHLRERVHELLGLITSRSPDTQCETCSPAVLESEIHGGAIRFGRNGSGFGVRLGRLRLDQTMKVESFLEFAAESILGNLNQLGPADDVASAQIDIDLTLLHSPATHSIRRTSRREVDRVGGSPGPFSTEDVDLRGYDASRHALVLSADLNGALERFVWSYEPHLAWQTQVRSLTKRAESLDFKHPTWLSFEAVSTRNWEEFTGHRLEPVTLKRSAATRAEAANSIRIPAVAGTFYPSEEGELRRLVDSLVGTSAAHPKEAVALQVPHAGLIYSGAVAAATLSSSPIPSSVIIISPKHHPAGANCALAPYQRWGTVGHQFETDFELQNRLLDEIPNLELDAAAHQDEHGIEVELPLLAQIAPRVRVVGIALGAANLDDCLRIGAGLARVLAATNPRPLIIISSDMNHFANDQQTRRLDEIAMAALESLDPALIYRTIVDEHQISMCGVRPAVATIAALKQLNLVSKCQRIGYATSGEISGNLDQVVGYAGLSFQS